jgi:ParB-like chromosome segregation protein Spo0J
VCPLCPANTSLYYLRMNPSPIVTLARHTGEPLVITYRPVASLKPDPRNARTHPKRQVEQIAVSIRESGFTNPILIDADGGIIAGHGRLLGAKAIGMAEVPTMVLSG